MDGLSYWGYWHTRGWHKEDEIYKGVTNWGGDIVEGWHIRVHLEHVAVLHNKPNTIAPVWKIRVFSPQKSKSLTLCLWARAQCCIDRAAHSDCLSFVHLLPHHRHPAEKQTNDPKIAKSMCEWKLSTDLIESVDYFSICFWSQEILTPGLL